MGMRACGKTTIGELAAKRLGRRFVDLDDRTRRGFRESSIREIWMKHGEAAWRRAELAALRIVLTESPSMVALGGGTPMIPEARADLERERSANAIRSVYLRCSAEELQRRLADQAGDRASLTGESGGGVVQEVPELLAMREPAYLALADAQIDTGTLSVEQAVEALIKLCLPPGSPPPPPPAGSS